MMTEGETMTSKQKVVKTTDPKTNTAIELRYDNLDKPGAEVTIYRAGVFAGTYSLAVADPESLKCRRQDGLWR